MTGVEKGLAKERASKTSNFSCKRGHRVEKCRADSFLCLTHQRAQSLGRCAYAARNAPVMRQLTAKAQYRADDDYSMSVWKCSAHARRGLARMLLISYCWCCVYINRGGALHDLAEVLHRRFAASCPPLLENMSWFYRVTVHLINPFGSD